MERKFYRINQYIRAPQLRVLGEEGKQVGVMSLSEALTEANKLGVDLVEIAPTANPPVAKLINYKKFQYLEEKRERRSKKAKKGGGVKEVRFTPFIAKADFDFRVKRVTEFLKEANKVKVVVRFTNRQLPKREFGYQILKQVREALSSQAEPETEPKWFGPNLIMTLTPVKGDHEKKQIQNSTVDSPTI